MRRGADHEVRSAGHDRPRPPRVRHRRGISAREAQIVSGTNGAASAGERIGRVGVPGAACAGPPPGRAPRWPPEPRTAAAAVHRAVPIVISSGKRLPGHHRSDRHRWLGRLGVRHRRGRGRAGAGREVRWPGCRGAIGGRVFGGDHPTPGISAREAEVLAALGEHLTNAEIGSRLLCPSALWRVTSRPCCESLRGRPPRLWRRSHRPRRPVNQIASAPRLPAPLTPFIGRAAERAALTDALPRAPPGHRRRTGRGGQDPAGPERRDGGGGPVRDGSDRRPGTGDRSADDRAGHRGRTRPR